MLKNLIIYRGFADMELLKLREEACSDPLAAADFYIALIEKAQQRGLSGNLWQTWFLDNLLTFNNIFSRAASKHKIEELPRYMLEAVAVEIEKIREAALLPIPMDESSVWRDWCLDFHPLDKKRSYSRQYEETLSQLGSEFWTYDTEKTVAWLAKYHSLWGYGDLCRFTFFSWEGDLHGISRTDTIALEELFGYDDQKKTLMENTSAFLSGKRANNMLLYGERGTGKSSMIKAVANYHAGQGLRLVALSRGRLSELADLVDVLSQYESKFIIFLDDLSFNNNDKEYKELKMLIEGGVESLPENILLYATSNRRHLIEESFSDRMHMNEDVYVSDTLSEKLSLADRFGMTVIFPVPDQEQYLGIVDGIAQREGLVMDKEELHKEAIRWERWQNSRSGRTAKQFIYYMLSQRG